MALFGDTNDNRGEIQTKLIAPAGVIASPWEMALRLLSWLQRDVELRRSRRALLDLTDDQLRDVGLTREEARREGHRSLYLD